MAADLLTGVVALVRLFCLCSFFKRRHFCSFALEMDDFALRVTMAALVHHPFLETYFADDEAEGDSSPPEASVLSCVSEADEGDFDDDSDEGDEGEEEMEPNSCDEPDNCYEGDEGDDGNESYAPDEGDEFVDEEEGDESEELKSEVEECEDDCLDLVE